MYNGDSVIPTRSKVTFPWRNVGDSDARRLNEKPLAFPPGLAAFPADMDCVELGRVENKKHGGPEPRSGRRTLFTRPIGRVE